MVLTDADGNDLCSQTETLSSLKIYGNLSGQYASTGNMREDGVMYIKFNADLPDERDIKPLRFPTTAMARRCMAAMPSTL